MLKKMRLGGIVLASLLAATGCQNEEIVQNNGAQGQAFTLVASKGIQSRTHLIDTEGGKKQTVWSTGDKIYVSCKDGKVTGVLTLDPEDANKTSGTFRGYVFGDPAKLAYSVFPVPTDGTTLDLSEVVGGGQLNAPMIGAINQDPNAETDVQFENVCGVLYVDIENSKGKSLEISAKEGAENQERKDINFAKTATISWDDNAKKPIITFEGSTSEITISNADGGEMYLPYFTTENDLDAVTFYAGNTQLNDEPIDLSEEIVGKIVMDGIKSLKYENEEIKVNVAKIGDVTYTSLQEAFNAGGEITLLSDVVLSETAVLAQGKTAILDLNGQNISVPESTDKHIYAIENEGELTIKDSKGVGSISARGVYNGKNTANAKMIVTGGNFVAMDTDGGAAIFNKAELTIYDGSFSGGNCAVNNSTNGDTTINGGTFYGYVSYAIQNNGNILTINNATVNNSTKGFGAVACYRGTTTINDGMYTPTAWPGVTTHVVYVYDSNATININGGTFKMNYSEGAAPDSGEAVASYYNGKVEITGGTFFSHFDNVSPVQLSSGSIIKGGTYLNHSGNPINHSYITNYVCEGYGLNDDGTVTQK